MKPDAVLLDTGFFIRLLNPQYPQHENARGFFRYFLDKEHPLICSTISIAEFCVIGDLQDLPLRNLQILPFNLSHGKRTGELAKVAYQARREKAIELKQRLLIPNDTKLFAQADFEEYIKYYLSADTESFKIFNALNTSVKLNFQFIDLNKKHTEVFGLLDL